MSYVDRGFRLAKNILEFSDYIPQRIGAVIMHKHRPVAVGYNIQKTNPLQQKYNIYRNFTKTNGKMIYHRLHAEAMAMINLKKLGIPADECEIFVYREYRDGTASLAKPCAACMELLRENKIKKIYYSISDDEYGVIGKLNED
jgi:deoxycytidylate deaminase